MILAASIGFKVLPIVLFLVVWILMLQCISALLIQAQGRALIAWNISWFGISPIFLRRPAVFWRLIQALVPSMVAGGTLYWILSHYAPLVTGIPYTLVFRIELAVGATFVLSIPRLLVIFNELRYPLWGEAGILDRVARSRAVGNTIYFTARGKLYLRDRFGATPEEFLRIVRRRPTSIATGA